MVLNTKFWIRVSLFNLLIVALLGLIMRYKIGFSFPWLDQKHLQHGHSHFAFMGWVAHTIFVLMVNELQKHRAIHTGRYQNLIIANLVCSYGMLISFAAQGYGFFSISFSTLSIFVAWVFAWFFFKNLKGLADKPFTYWFAAALWFNIASAVGTFTLAFMMASHNFNQNIHLASLYYYLHFQYNGFFLFACMGLFLARLNFDSSAIQWNRSVFWMFFLSCIPAYFLSILWAKLPVWLYVIVVASAVLQVLAWAKFLLGLRGRINSELFTTKWIRYIFVIVCLALSAKLLLQLGSTVPYVSKLAFGFRPIIIAYLHLILLAIISVFLLTYAYSQGLMKVNRLASFSLITFVVGAYLNEIVLGVQGIASFSYTVIPFVNEILFFVAALIFLGLLLFVFSQSKSKQEA